MNWKKLGLIFSPDQRYDWMHSHCQLPVIDHLSGDRYRVYFASRTKEQFSHIGFAEFDINDPKKILRVSEKPVLSPGPLGHFDEFGVYPSCMINVGEKKYMYYIGWIRGFENPMFYATIGLAISEDGGETYRRYSSVPLLDKSPHDPCLVTSPHVYFDEDIYRMTYVSGMKWERGDDGKLKSFYHIKYAESPDGISWKREGTVAIDFRENESNIARSAVIKDNGKYKMWFSYVKQPVNRYRIGYAESDNGRNWTRLDDSLAGITVSESGHDSEMICYPCVFSHKGKKYMLYNGNNFGQNGFFMAEEE
jgi:predicted GH43/DUF377 family glycosyl hydrolase